MKFVEGKRPLINVNPEAAFLSTTETFERKNS